jgi:hypothetical protein
LIKEKGRSKKYTWNNFVVGGYSNTKCQDDNDNTTSYIAKDLNKGEQQGEITRPHWKTLCKISCLPYLTFFPSYLPSSFPLTYHLSLLLLNHLHFHGQIILILKERKDIYAMCICRGCFVFCWFVHFFKRGCNEMKILHLQKSKILYKNEGITS